ncbi:MAG: LapA family protein [Gammaproteobacteria bacterium]|nr:LapA family protein [Gammaproteobacteria bacterium]
MKRLLISLLLLLLALIGVVFARLNADGVAVDFYFLATQAPLALLLYLALTIGVVAGLMVSFVMVVRARHETKRLRKRLAVCEQEIKNLREIPIKDQF